MPTMLRLRNLGFGLNTRGLLSTTVGEDLILSNAAKTLKSGPFLSSLFLSFFNVSPFTYE